MPRVATVVLAIGCLAAVGLAVVELTAPQWLGGDPKAEAEGPEHGKFGVRKRTAGALGHPGRRNPNIFEQRAAYRAGLTKEVPKDVELDFTPVNRVDAMADFEALMEALEVRADRGLPDRQEGDEIYRAANDSFTALSSMLDATDRSDAQLLETAHMQLRETLARLEIEPTSHHDAERSTYKQRRRQRPGHFVPRN